MWKVITIINGMKKAVFILAVMMTCFSHLHAQAYDYLTFQTSDGNLYSIKASGLVINFADGEMKAVSGSESLKLRLTELTRMYFSDTNGVDLAEIEGSMSPVLVFGVDGKQLGAYSNLDSARASLKPGVYVLKTGNRTVKMTVR